MLKPIAVQFCFIGTLLFQASVVRAQNIVSNGGFEAGNFSGWTTNSLNVSGQIAGAAADSGSFGAEFTELIFMGDEGDEDQMTQSVPTQTGAFYLFSFWANGARQSSLGAMWNSMNLLTNSIYYYPNFSALGSGWTNFQSVVQATSSGAVLTFSFRASPGANNSTSLTYLDDVSVLPLAGFNQIQVSGLVTNAVKLSFIGIPGGKYALDRTFNLTPPVQWTPQSTNIINLTGSLRVTNDAVTTTNNFWRFRALFASAPTAGQSP